MSPSKTMWLENLVAFSVMTTASSFMNTGGSRAPFFIPGPRGGHTRVTSSLSVLIYGWDGDDEIAATDVDVFGGNTAAASSCSPTGAVLAESIARNQDKVGTLARLAVAFSPPERTLELENIDRVNIICVGEGHIELEAVLCEDQGCVSLFVPITFPRECAGEDNMAWMEKCVLENLEQLDAEGVESQPTIITEEGTDVTNTIEDDDDLDELCSLYTKAEYPSWWIPPECSDDLVAECDAVISLLNDEEFQGDVNNLARRGLETLNLADRFKVRKAVVAAVGPAGLCLKARAVSQYEGGSKRISVLDVPLPFGGEPKQDTPSLRAAVLGTVAAAQVGA